MTSPRRLSGLPCAIAGSALLWLTASTPIPFGVPTTPAVTLLDSEAWIMSGTGPCCLTPESPWSQPTQGLIQAVVDRFITGTIAPANVGPHYSVDSSYGLATPEQLHPFTGLESLSFDTSVQWGADVLDEQIRTQIAAGNSVVVLGVSQSASIITREMSYLATLPADERPDIDQLAFVLLGDGNNPNGGLLERFDGADIPALLTFSGATPDNLYPTDVFTLEYDGWADFPKYPLNIVADLNALLGMATVHGTYAALTPEQLATAIELPTAGDTMTHYWMIPTGYLPLLLPFQQLGVPAWLIHLIEPALRVIVNLGYGDPDHGWSAGPANAPTVAGLFPTDVNPFAVLEDLVDGALRGADAALTDLGLPTLPSLITDPVTYLATALGSLADQTDPLIHAVSSGLHDAVNSVVIPDWLAAALSPVSGALNSLDSVVGHVINDQLDPLIQQAVYALGDPLRDALTDIGADDRLTNAVYVIEQLLPVVLGAPANFVTNDLHFLAEGTNQLVAGDFGGFVDQLELIPAGDITMAALMGLGLPFLALQSILAGVPLTI
ncbi:PE-PPE domain-containing protein [Mycolicibacter heraklionensis]|uniref:PE-PPE domain-containing protein n=1 Tax=Mycolicibacter heraklionensis TaxID=512402 RepID=A0A9X7WFD0_9MYCO|nr:PE-PPE domain-containing protein [Mycolicibacter heraklionensis]QZA06250.1 PE-PPE domain-containing protein [Mycolicibacter heraklionensis]